MLFFGKEAAACIHRVNESEVIKIERIGLDSSQVRELTAKGKVNVQIDRTAKTTKDIIKENVLTYFNLIFLITALHSCR